MCVHLLKYNVITTTRNTNSHKSYRIRLKEQKFDTLINDHEYNFYLVIIITKLLVLYRQCVMFNV